MIEKSVVISITDIRLTRYNRGCYHWCQAVMIVEMNNSLSCFTDLRNFMWKIS